MRYLSSIVGGGRVMGNGLDFFFQSFSGGRSLYGIQK